MKVKGTGSRCLLEECVKDNYYARFHPHSYHCCKEMKFIPRLDVKFSRLDANCGRTDGRKVEPLYRTLLKAGAIKIASVFDMTLSFGYLYSLKCCIEPVQKHFDPPSFIHQKCQ